MKATPAATLPGRMRLKSQRHFRTVYSRGRRQSGAWMTVVVTQRRRDDPTASGPAAPRLGVSVSKDHGGAVRRNKLKRLLREAFRLERHRLPATADIVLIPKVREDRVPLAELRDELVRLVTRAWNAPPRGPKGAARHPQKPRQTEP